MRKFYALFLSMFLTTTVAFAQSGIKVEGRVVDSQGYPVTGATVIETTAPSNAAIVDVDGNFTLTLKSDNASLEIHFMGYITEYLEVGNRAFFDVELQEDLQSIEEVVVVGYGVQKKKLVTGATSQVSGESLTKLSSNGVMGALQSKTTGVQISSASAMPGEESSIIIRGVGTIGDATPLYVIDGVVGASLSSVSPSDIESIDILKDAASAAIYGSRAANGVVLVTTKRGKNGVHEIRYDGYYGFQSPSKSINSLDALGYMDIMDEALNTDPSLRGTSDWITNDWKSMIPAKYYNAIMDGSWTGSDWLSEIENDGAPMQSHSVTFSGGNDRTRYSLGYNYTEQEGVYGVPVTPEYLRHNVRLNIDDVLFRANDLDIVKVGATAIYTYSKSSGISLTNRFSNDLQNMMTMPSIYPIYDDEGDYYDYTDYQNDGWTYSAMAELPNPIGMMVDRDVNETEGHRILGNAFIEIQPIENLKVRSSFGYKYYGSSKRNFTPTYSYSSKHSIDNETVSQTAQNQYSWTWDNTVSYNFDVENHGFDFVVGQSLEQSGLGSYMSASNSGLTFAEEFDYAWLTNTSGVSSGTTNVTGYPYVNNAVSSFFGRVNYNYDETYLLTAMMRADGSTKFAEGNQWGYFPSVSAGWVLTNESWLESVAGLDFLKLRASWGQNGNCNIDNFQYLATIAYQTDGQYVFSDDKVTSSTGAYADVLANPDITWETSEQVDVGIDARFFNSRFSVTLDYYNKATKDWLVVAPIPTIYGTGASYINGGDVVNRGVELGLGWNDNVGDFSYSVNLNASYNKNEVTRIANASGIIEGHTDVTDQNVGTVYRAEVGMPIGYFYGYETAGIFQTQEEVDATSAKLSTAAPGDIIYVDKNGDGEITDEDKTMIGDPNPDFIASFSISLEYKGFDLNITTNGEFGHQIMQAYRTMNINQAANYPLIISDQRWTGAGTSNTYPSISNTDNFTRMCDMFVQDADYLRFQNITLGYDFTHIWKNCPLHQLRLYATLQNYFTITDYDGFDPAVGSNGGYDDWAKGIDIGYYATPKVVLFGVNITF